MPVVDPVPAWYEESVSEAVYLVSRTEEETTEVSIEFTVLADSVEEAAQTLSDPELDAANTLGDPIVWRCSRFSTIRVGAGIATNSLPSV